MSDEYKQTALPLLEARMAYAGRRLAEIVKGIYRAEEFAIFLQ